MPEYLKRARVQRTTADRQVADTVRAMLDEVEQRRDEAVLQFARKLDGWQGGDFRVGEDQIARVARELPETFKEDFAYCRKQVTEFARRQLETLVNFEDEFGDGIILGQKHIPVSRVGCYIPGGKYPLISAALMSIAVARTAGVGHIIACAPPREGREIYPATLYAMHEAGADEIYTIGGVQALASMAFGCVGMQPVDLITGPGNPYVAEAKRQLFGMVGIDLPAGPTEILVIADDSADPSLVAADLVGQAEHGPDSPAWLITTSRAFGERVAAEVKAQLETLPETVETAWREHGEITVVADDDEAIALSDEYAPEHLEIMTRRDDYYLSRLRNYGSLFVGEESTVAYGDKGVGTNHTLPTGRAARYTGGLWVGKFVKTVTYQRLSRAASATIAPVIARVCRMEGMTAHAITADMRQRRYGPDAK